MHRPDVVELGLSVQWVYYGKAAGEGMSDQGAAGGLVAVGSCEGNTLSCTRSAGVTDNASPFYREGSAGGMNPLQDGSCNSSA